MELRHLQCFLVLAEELSFSRAARRLHIAQPSLSQQMRQLETELATDLFDRSVRPIRLTNAGQLLMESAAGIVTETENTLREVRRAGRGEVGRIRVGYSYGGLYDLVLALLGRLREAWPSTTIAVYQLAEREQVDALHSRRVDVVIGRVTEPITSDDVVIKPLREEKLLAILPECHPCAGGDSVRLADLHAEQFVMFPRRLEPVVFDNYVRACVDAGFTMRLEHEVTDAQTQALIIAAGLGVGLTGDHLALRFPSLVYLPVEPPTTLAEVAALWCEEYLPDSVRPFLDGL